MPGILLIVWFTGDPEGVARFTSWADCVAAAEWIAPIPATCHAIPNVYLRPKRRPDSV